MTLKSYFHFLFIFLRSTLSAQTVVPVQICVLPQIANESSGLVCNSNTNIWTHNDSGDSARIYNIDSLGNLQRVFYLNHTHAMDIEDITTDSLKANFYIEDAGNNLNNRHDLRIYKIPNPSGLIDDTITPAVINFTYPDQTQFPPALTNQNFDCEGFVHLNDSLYLFTKNRGTSNYSKMYRLPDSPGNYTATLVDSVYTGTWITSAALSPNKKTLILLSDASMWLFKNFAGANFFAGTATHLILPFSQKEGVCFVNDTAIYLSDEKNNFNGGNLYYLNLSSYITSVKLITEPLSEAAIYPNPSNGKITVTLNLRTDTKVELKIIDSTGKKAEEKNYKLYVGINTKEINLENLKNGNYILQLKSGRQLISRKFILEK